MGRRKFLGKLTSIFIYTMLCPNANAAEPELKLRNLYNKDLSFSKLAISLENTRITVKGFMAPPLKAGSKFFVLTKKPMSVCPFCETEAEWPDDILAIYTKRIIKVVPFNVPILVRGVLSLGADTDSETLFVSRVRLMDSAFKKG
jgi:hypothetical protein